MIMMIANIKTATNTAPHTIPMMAMFGNPLDEAGSLLPKTKNNLYIAIKC